MRCLPACCSTDRWLAFRFAIGRGRQDALDRIIYDDNAGTLSYDSDGTGAAAQVTFAELDPGLALSASDFFVV